MFELRTVGPSSLLQDVCPCKVCEKLSHAVYLVPLCSTCTEYNVNNFAQFVCFASRINGVPPLTYCKLCESLAVPSEGQSSESEWISCLRCRVVLACWNCKRGARRIGSFFAYFCTQCASFRRCSKCDFFEYAPGHPATCCASEKSAVVSVAQSSECAPRSL